MDRGKLSAVGMALALSILIVAISFPVFAVVVNFPDPGLEAAIRTAIGIPTEDILDTDLIGLTSLSAQYSSISNLEGIQYCIDLAELSLDGNQIIDIGPLSGLTDLTWLVLGYNEIVDISPLSGLTDLMYLFLYHNNEIVDISPLSGLTNLRRLYLYVNQIVDISPLSGLTNLTELGLDRNEIVNITALSGMTNLTYLLLNSNQIVDLAPLVSNAGIDSGDHVNVNYNCLDLALGSPDVLDIQTLQARGANIIYAAQNASCSTPEMDVLGKGASITSGDDSPSTTDGTDFGTVAAASGTKASTFIITNSGDGTLSLTNTPRVTIGGTNAADFTLTTDATAGVSSEGGTTTFVVTFDPTVVGVRTATISIANNDADENPYNFAIQGTGTDKGDVNGNGGVDVLDVRLCLQIATGVLPGTSAQQAAADVDDDGDVDMDDAQILAEYVIGIRTVLP